MLSIAPIRKIAESEYVSLLIEGWRKISAPIVYDGKKINQKSSNCLISKPAYIVYISTSKQTPESVYYHLSKQFEINSPEVEIFIRKK